MILTAVIMLHLQAISWLMQLKIINQVNGLHLTIIFIIILQMLVLEHLFQQANYIYMMIQIMKLN